MSKEPAEEKLYTLTEVAKLTDISYPTLLRYVKEHGDRIPSVGKGRTQRFPEKALEVFRKLRQQSRRGRKGTGDGKDRDDLSNVWLAVADIEDLDWGEALRRGSPFRWQIDAEAARSGLAATPDGDEASPESGDVMLLFNVHPKLEELAGWALSAGDDLLSLELQPGQPFEPPVRGELLRRHLPHLDFFKSGARIAPFTHEQWAVLLEILEHEKHDTGELPPSTVPPKFAVARRARIQTPEAVAPGESFEVRMTLENEGNATWHRGEIFRADTELRGGPQPMPLGSWSLNIEEDVLPLGETTLSFQLNAPPDAGSFRLLFEIYGDGTRWGTDSYGGRFWHDLEVVAETDADVAPPPDERPARPEPAKVAPGASRLRAEPPAPPAADEPASERIVEVRQQVFNTVIHQLGRPAEALESTTLDVHIRPSLRRDASEVLRRTDAGIADAVEDGSRADESPYAVLLSLHRYQDGQPSSVRFFNGPLLLGELRRGDGRGDAEYGARLHRALFHDVQPRNDELLVEGEAGQATLAAGYQQALGVAEGTPLRIQLRIDSAITELHEHAWEYLWDPGGLRQPLACNADTPFSRFLHVSGLPGETRPAVSEQEPLRLLAVRSSPEKLGDTTDLFDFDANPMAGMEQIDRAELEAVRKGLEGLELVDARFLGEDRLTLEDLDRTLQDAADGGEPFHVLHLLCHGMDGGAGRSTLVMESEDRDDALVDEAVFARRIGAHAAGGLRLVVLVSCFTARPSSGHALRGIARRLVEEGVPAVVAMQHTLEWRSGQHFAQRMYRHLLHSGEIDRAVNAARLELKHRGDSAAVRRDEWGIPVLFTRLPAGRLFDVDDADRERVEPDAPVKASDLRDVPGVDPERMVQRAMERAGAALGASMNLTVDTSLLARELRRALRSSAATVPDDEPGDELDEEVPRTPLRAVSLRPAMLENLYEKRQNHLVVRESAVAQAMAALNAGKHVILTGPPGTGKTTLAEDLCRLAAGQEASRDHVLATATSDWTTFDTIGGYMPGTDQRLSFRPGVFLDALRGERWLVIDEINRADIDKAFGELFTVLSGQAVTLPYRVRRRPVRILPARGAVAHPASDYRIAPSWRILATMNVYDRASLFAMSKAFMRRFAFVEIEVPEAGDYAALLDTFADRQGLKLAAESPVRKLLGELFRAGDETENPLMYWRSLGPAIALDILRYLRQRRDAAGSVGVADVADALALYVLPQLDDLQQQPVESICRFLARCFRAHGGQASLPELLRRIRALFPYFELVVDEPGAGP